MLSSCCFLLLLLILLLPFDAANGFTLLSPAAASRVRLYGRRRGLMKREAPLEDEDHDEQLLRDSIYSALNSQGNDDDDAGYGVVLELYIEYCTGCKWGLRSFWMAQELLLSMHARIESITIIPTSEPSGRFRILADNPLYTVLWDRTVQNGFPDDMDELMEIVRGHSNNPWSDNDDIVQVTDGGALLSEAPDVTIYFDAVKYPLRAVWMMQEFQSTFGDKIGSFVLVPTNQENMLILECPGDELVWELKKDSIPPPIKVLKQKLRDAIDPTRDLGHSDDDAGGKKEDDKDDMMDDDEAAEARNFFGVA